jgi:septum formation protein
MPNYPVILASASPRRKELLGQVIDRFEVVPADLDEESLTLADPHETATGLALAKAKGVFAKYPGHLVIGSDTVVAFRDAHGCWQQFGKPADESGAVTMLRTLAGRTHEVITGLALVSPLGDSVRYDSTLVTFRNLDSSEIEKYVSSGEPVDKAGAYAIQGGAADFVRSVEGSISNVIGLPIELLREMLAELA